MTPPLRPDWYPNPAGGLSYWDGRQWTGWAQPVAPGRRTDEGEALAGWWQRVGQYLLDSLVIQVITLPITIPLTVTSQSRLRPLLAQLDEEVRAGGRPDLAQFWHRYLEVIGPSLLLSSVLGLVVAFTYWSAWLRSRGSSLGMRAVGVEVRTVEPVTGRLPWGVVVRRVLAFQLGVILVTACLPLGINGHVGLLLLAVILGLAWFVLDVLWPLWDRRNQTLHDKIAGTLLVRRP